MVASQLSTDDSFQSLYKLPESLIPAGKQITKLSGRYLKIENGTKTFDWIGFRSAVQGNSGCQIVPIQNPANSQKLGDFSGGGLYISQAGNQNVLIFQNNGIFSISTFGFNPSLSQFASLSQISSVAKIATDAPMVGLNAATGAAQAPNAGDIAHLAGAQIAAVTTAQSVSGGNMDPADHIAQSVCAIALEASASGVAAAAAAAIADATRSAASGAIAVPMSSAIIAAITAGIIQSQMQPVEVVAMVNWITDVLNGILSVEVDRTELTAQVNATFTNLKWAHDSGFADFSSSSTGSNSSWEYRVVFATPTNDPNVFSSIVATIRVEANIKEESSWWGLSKSRSENFSSTITALKLSVNKSFVA